MNEDELEKEVIEIEQELAREKHRPQSERRWKQPMLIMGGLLVAFLFIIVVIPDQAIKLNAEPGYVPRFDEVVTITTQEIVAAERNVQDRQAEIRNFLEPNNPQVKQFADRIISKSQCPVDTTCYAKAMFYFVQRNVQYVSDPPDEYIKPFDEIIVSQVGDCDDHAVLLANLLQTIGIQTKFVFVPNHVYVQAYLPQSAKRYHDRTQDGWVNLDATCADCDFGELAPEIAGQQRRFV